MNAELADILSRALRFIPRDGEEERDLAEDIQTALKDLQPTKPASRITPGPWKVVDRWSVVSADGLHVAEVNGYGAMFETREANARLIAVAPELAMAALSAREMLGEMLRTAASNDQADAIDEVSSALTAALAKAGLLS